MVVAEGVGLSEADWREAARTVRGQAELQRLFRSGRYPSAAPDGRTRGTFIGLTLGGPFDRVVGALAGLWMPWLGKRFDAASATGDNLLGLGPARVARLAARVAARLGWAMAVDPDGTARAFPFVTSRGPGMTDPEVEVLRIVYSYPGAPSPELVRRVLDEVVEIEPGLLLGKAHLRVAGGRWRLAGYFALRTGG
jgi:hypothetical protein